MTNTGGNGASATALTSTTGNATGVSGNGDRTLVTVWQNTAFTGQNYQHTVHFGDQSGNEAYGHSSSRIGNAGTPIGNHYWGAGFDSTATADLMAHLAISSWDGDGGTGTNGLDAWFFDGTAVGASDRGALATGMDQFQIGSRLGPFTEGFSGHMLEVIMFDSVLTEDERNALGGYIETKYGITVANATFAVPEPAGIAIWSLIGLGLAGFGYFRTRRNK